jgi:hypothetical protein
MSCILCDKKIPLVKRYEVPVKNDKGEKMLLILNQEQYDKLQAKIQEKIEIREVFE